LIDLTFRPDWTWRPRRRRPWGLDREGCTSTAGACSSSCSRKCWPSKTGKLDNSMKMGKSWFYSSVFYLINLTYYLKHFSIREIFLFVECLCFRLLLLTCSSAFPSSWKICANCPLEWTSIQRTFEMSSRRPIWTIQRKIKIKIKKKL